MIGKILFYPVYTIVVVVAAVVGFLIGLVSVLPGLAVGAVAGVFWMYEVLTHWWFDAHEELHRRAAALVGVPVEDEGLALADGGSSPSHVTYSICPRSTPTPGQAVVVALAPFVLAPVAILSFSAFQILSFPLSLLTLIPALAGRYSRPTGPDAGSIINSAVSDPLHPFNLVFVPLAVGLFVLDLPRYLHYRLSYFSDALWFSLLYITSRLLASTLAPYVSRFSSSLPLGV